MKRVFSLLLMLALTLPLAVRADEGMWLPLLSKERVKEMRKAGMKLTAEDIYSINQSCLTNSVVGLANEGLPFKSFATGSLISKDGLVITNYHPVMRFVEFYSSDENDFMKYGYWASKREEESTCHGLWIKQLVRVEDVTAKILVGTEGLTGRDFDNKVTENNKIIVKEATKGTRSEAQVSTVFAGNQYLLSVYNIYKDVRLVAAPPMAIGKYGGLSDNWQWPRYTGDFALLRIYVNQNQNPARFNREKNVPYKSSSYLKVSLDGVKEGDFAMVLGYPGSTRQYIHADGVDKKIYRENVARLEIGAKKLEIMQGAIAMNPELRHRYTTRISSTSNGYLKYRGEVAGASSLEVVKVKAERDSLFNIWANSTPELKAKYGTVLSDLTNTYNKLSDYNVANLVINDVCHNGSEIVGIIGKFEKLVSMYARKKAPKEGAVNAEIRRVRGLVDMFFNVWSYDVDRELMREMIIWSWETIGQEFQPKEAVNFISEYDGDVEKMTQELFSESIFTDKDKIYAMLDEVPAKGVDAIKNDRLYQLCISYYRIFVERVNMQQQKLQRENQVHYKKFVEGLVEMAGGYGEVYPDANRGLRVAYGTVQGYKPEEAITYNYYTTLEGMVKTGLMNPSNNDYYVPRKLRELQANKDFGVYASKDGELVTCFITNCHTTSGNSGSPVVNSRGEFIGINFDRAWQGVVSDYHYSEDLSRNIAVDARYIFFILEKYSRSQYILDEVEFIKK